MRSDSFDHKHPEDTAGMSEENLAKLRQLHRVIDEEMRKPIDEQDDELISNCIGMIAGMKGVKGSFSAEEINEQIAIVKAKAAQGESACRSRRVRRPVMMAVCAVLAVLVCAFTAYANPALRAWFMQLRLGGIGYTVTDHDVTYEYMGETVLYNNVENLLAAEGISIYYPSVLPDGVWITGIERIDINDQRLYSFEFNTTDISMKIQMGSNLIPSTNPLREEYSTPIGNFYIFEGNGFFMATAWIKEAIYDISVKNNFELKGILDNFKEIAQ